jgi:multisubunit Na+/H+ antiporter MnhE subunit
MAMIAKEVIRAWPKKKAVVIVVHQNHPSRPMVLAVENAMPVDWALVAMAMALSVLLMM